MRKVTASAVILTALTGCSQSGVPSNQWSFEIPADDQAAFSETDQGFSSELFSEDTAFLSRASALSADLSTDLSTQSAIMGPAVEQPAVSTLTQSSSPTGSNVASADFSQLVSTATSNNARNFIRTTARPDPIADVRSYLNRRSSPGLITSRLPYSSDIYLPSSPPAAPLSALGALPASSSSTAAYAPSPAASLPATPASVTVPADAPAEVNIAALPQTSVPLPSVPASVTPMPTEVATAPAGGLPSLYDNVVVSQTAPVSIAGVESSAATPSPTAARTISLEADAESDLPVLQPSRPLNDSAALAETATTRRTSIGTSILRDLQRDESGTIAAEPSAEPSAVVPGIIEPSSLDQQDVDTLSIALLTESLEGMSPAGMSPADPAAATEDRPTLEELVRSIPERKESPLLVSFRSADSLSSSEAIGSQAVESQLAEGQLADMQTQGLVEQETVRPSANQIDYEIDTRSSQVDSPLLEGFSAGVDEVSLSTIYVPISEEISVDASAALIQAAIAALGDEVATAPFTGAQPGSSALSTIQVAPAEATSLEVEQLGQTSEIARLLRDQLMNTQSLNPSKISEQNPDTVFDVLKSAVETATERAQVSQRAAAPAIDLLTQPARKYRQRIIWQ